MEPVFGFGLLVSLFILFRRVIMEYILMPIISNTFGKAIRWYLDKTNKIYEDEKDGQRRHKAIKSRLRRKLDYKKHLAD